MEYYFPSLSRIFPLLVERKRLQVPIALMRWLSPKKPLIEPLLWRKFGGGQFGPHSRLIRQNFLVFFKHFSKYPVRLVICPLTTVQTPLTQAMMDIDYDLLYAEPCALFRSSFSVSFPHIFQSYSGPYPKVTMDTPMPGQGKQTIPSDWFTCRYHI